MTAHKRSSAGKTINRQVTESKPTVGFEGNLSSLRILAVKIAGARTETVPVIEDLPDLPGALCRDMGDQDLFFPERSQAKAKQAKALCAQCPARVACLDYALDWDRKHPAPRDRSQGIWGGTTEVERKAIIERETDAVA